MNVQRACLVLLLALVPSAFLSAESLTTGADFLLVNTGARPDAMGGAFGAVADDVNTLSYNPAGLGNIRLPEVGYGRYEFVAGVHFDFVGLASPVGRAGVLALGYIGMGTEDFNSTDDPIAAYGKALEQALILGWGRSFGRLHVGVSAKYVRREIGTVTGTGFLGDVGFRYRLQPRLTLAGSLLNAGSEIRMVEGERPPTTARAGVAWRALEAYPHSLDLVMDASLLFHTHRPLYGWGTEYWFQERYALRLGWVGNEESEGFTAGAGFKVGFLQIDYAFQPYEDLGSTHRVSGILRWNGGWMKGGEPNAPRFVRVRNVTKGIEVRWDKPAGPVEMYEVMLRPLDGSAPRVYSRLMASPAILEDVPSGTLVAISMRSVAPGGNKSFPTQAVYAERMVEAGREAQVETRPSEEKGVFGALGKAGLELRWEPPRGSESTGYHLYLRTESGKVTRLSREAKTVPRLFLPDVSGLEGGEIFVTALHPTDGSERRVGSFVWRPTPEESRVFRDAPRGRLNATLQGNGKMYLDWDPDAEAVGYTLLYGTGGDGIYQIFGDLPKNQPYVVLNLLRAETVYRFMVVSRDATGRWIKVSTEFGKPSEGVDPTAADESGAALQVP